MEYTLNRLITDLRILFNTYVYNDVNHVNTLVSLIKNNTRAKNVNIEYSPNTHIILEYNADDGGIQPMDFSGISKAFIDFYNNLFNSGVAREIIENKCTSIYKYEMLELLSSSIEVIVWNMHNITSLNDRTLYVYL